MKWCLAARSAKMLVMFLVAHIWAAHATAGGQDTPPLRRPALTDFAFHQVIKVAGGAAAYRLELPEQVYANVDQRDLNHLAVFNARGELVPWFLQTPTAETRYQFETIPLVLFDGHATSQAKPRSTSVSLYQDAASLSVDINISPEMSAGMQQAGPQANVYYVDLKRLGQGKNLRQLKLQWDAAEPRHYEATVEVSQSRDFQNWKPVAKERVFRFMQGLSELEQNQVKVSPLHSAYLRIAINSETPLPALVAVHGQFEVTTRTTPAERWHAVPLEAQLNGGEYWFETPASLNIKRLRIRTPRQNSLGEVSVWSWRNDQWQLRRQTTLAQLQHEGSTVDKSLVELNVGPAKRWRLLFSADSIGYSEGLTEVEYSYGPQELVFLRHGEGPFTLAYGVLANADANIAWPHWLNNPDFPAKHLQSTEVTLAPPEQQVAEWKPGSAAEASPLSSRKWLFWSGAVLFVAVMLALAFYLFREINQAK